MNRQARKAVLDGGNQTAEKIVLVAALQPDLVIMKNENAIHVTALDQRNWNADLVRVSVSARGRKQRVCESSKMKPREHCGLATSPADTAKLNALDQSRLDVHTKDVYHDKRQDRR